ncbi:sulfur carrier protein ThiS [Alkalicoccobacillus porphyridii]|uniref:Sulfur carrier protein ThiS n=1 Tax=Alkalicoccobacillus porphyridii TaxID=2597270 RepID=A0A553ZZ34_9BACI|nr:sulfur carrier protein ThiS [Alkalicoccobacillus porphyridii]TSB46703.1 sulfur carrier protein ThiS [Alkalicoccobacillus porphyridii]
MKLLVNGEQSSVDVKTLYELVEQYKINQQLVVTEVDGLIIGQEERTQFELKEGMKIELVHFVGGG